MSTRKKRRNFDMPKVMKMNQDGSYSQVDLEEFLAEVKRAASVTPGLVPTHNKELLRDPAPEVHNTGMRQKRAHWPKFAKLIADQFEHGGDKYALGNQPDKEFTDLVCEVSPGKTGFDWIFQTIVKYCGRYIQFRREKDLLKMATYCYIAWLKSGAHLKEQHDTDTRADGQRTTTEEPAPECDGQCDTCEQAAVELGPHTDTVPGPDHEFNLE
jgi:hypothetical protein